LISLLFCGNISYRRDGQAVFVGDPPGIIPMKKKPDKTFRNFYIYIDISVGKIRAFRENFAF
jgi:hypothetical protein